MRGRFAPSPTGYMHLGNIWCALISYISCKRKNGEFILRIEDIDTQRSKEEYVEAIVEDMLWLGFTWDIGPQVTESRTYRQSERIDIYESYLKQWRKDGLIYPCYCTRARLRNIASAPHMDEQRPVYDGRCKSMTEIEIQDISADRSPSWRIAVENQRYRFEDLFQGPQEGYIQKNLDDIVLKRGDGLYAYQLAVSIDDALMGVTEVIRGRDLLGSVPLQQYLITLLGENVPQYGHIPLLLDGEGVRLSKRQKGITIRELRQEGYQSGEILAFLAYETGLSDKRYPSLQMDELLAFEGFEKWIKKEDIQLTKIDI